MDPAKPLGPSFTAAATATTGRRLSVFAEGSMHNGSRELDLDAVVLGGGGERDTRDPLGWGGGLKIAILVQVSLLAALGTLNTAIINPAYVPLAKEFGISTVQASYQSTVSIALNGIGPFLWVPLANVYGRRPVYLFSTALGFAAALGSAYARSFAQLMVARVFTGFFPAAMSLGAATVMDLFEVGQRAMGVFTVLLTNGAHIAPIVGGLLGQYLGWRWTFRFAAICDGAMLLTISLCMPETLYIRASPAAPGPAPGPATASQPPPNPQPNPLHHYLTLLPSTHPHRTLKPSAFLLPALRTAKHPSVLFPALYYAAQYGFASILPSVTAAALFTEFFHWDTLTIGLAYGAALTIGCSVGEVFAGPVIDRIVKRGRQQRQKTRLGGGEGGGGGGGGEVGGGGDVGTRPEDRLRAIWTGALLVPTGLLLYGFTLQYRTHWIFPLLGMGVAACGTQALTTVCYTYSVESVERIERVERVKRVERMGDGGSGRGEQGPRDGGGDVGQVFNFCRQEIGMTFAFYAVRMGERIGFQWTFVFFACMGGVAFLPVGWLMWRAGRDRRGGEIGTGVQEMEEGVVEMGEKKGVSVEEGVVGEVSPGEPGSRSDGMKTQKADQGQKREPM